MHKKLKPLHHGRHGWLLLLGVLQQFLLPVQTLAATGSDVTESLRLQVRALRPGGEPSGADPVATRLVARIYERRGFTPAWSQPGQIRSLAEAVAASASDGLDPDEYQLNRIRDASSLLERGETISPADRAKLDLMLTDSIIRLAYHQRFGKTDPQTLKPRSSFFEKLDDDDPATSILRVIDSGEIATTLESSLPRNDSYRRLRSALARYRMIADSGGWPQVADGPTLMPGVANNRLSALARRLRIGGDLTDSDAYTNGATYDETLQAGVRRFQARHGLEVDGLVGERTLTALNISAPERVDQIRVNLERARWILDAQEDESVLVNIAGFQAFFVRDREVVWAAKVQVGETDHQTPVFRSRIERLVFNPKWTVPRSIATEEMLPEIKNDTGYLRAGDYDLYKPDGVLIDPDDVDWPTINEHNFDFTIVQRPGPGNALGRIKFEFPNEYSVYLHDTPSKALFDRAHRACSHGCIRLESPLELANTLLEGSRWQRDEIDSLIADGETWTVSLTRPVPILIQYWTAEVASDGTVYFYDDIYERDKPIIDALNSPYSGSGITDSP